MKTFEAIKAVMSEQISGYRILQSLLQKERVCLVNLNLSQIEDLSKEKDTIIIRLRLLEEERKRLLKNYYLEEGVKEEVDIQKLFKESRDDSFETLRLQIISLLQGIAELNEFNRILIDRSMNFFKNTINFLDSTGMNMSYQQKTHMISREA